ncbi:MAG TPA: NUDIX domain-containing protein [Patescibacteria group bacterium]|nr:NUDIX domain-containing protein [Patescibacteria group bacterium]
MNGFTQPPVTVDGVVFQLAGGVLHVLLIQRGADPFRGVWALPGGYISGDETTKQALRRVLRGKAGLSTKDYSLTDQLYTFDMPAVRDPRGHAISVAYMVLAKNISLSEAPQLETPTFFPVADLPKLAYDHGDIIRAAHERLRGKITYTNIVFGLLPELFTLTQLQMAYEAIIGHPLDKRNFRKKFLSLGLIGATGEHYLDGAHRPALLYRFKQQALQALSRSFE